MLRTSKYVHHDSLGTLNSFINGWNVLVMRALFPFFICFLKGKDIVALHCRR